MADTIWHLAMGRMTFIIQRSFWKATSSVSETCLGPSTADILLNVISKKRGLLQVTGYPTVWDDNSFTAGFTSQKTAFAICSKMCFMAETIFWQLFCLCSDCFGWKHHINKINLREVCGHFGRVWEMTDWAGAIKEIPVLPHAQSTNPAGVERHVSGG